MLPTLFDVCTPRDDVLRGNLTESDFAADLAQVLKHEAPAEYQDAGLFFANTHPTRGLKTLLQNVCQRLQGKGEQVASIFRLDTNFGGGKTHALIALVHTAQGMLGVVNPSEFVDMALVPTEPVRIAAFDGENADPVNGRAMGDGVKAYTPWGEIAYALGGRDGYEQVRKSDEAGIAPGAETIRALFGGRPTLILMDELAIYLRKQAAKDSAAGRQLSAFLSALFKAVESSPRVALVYTLAIGKNDQKAIDAYSQENQSIADMMLEAESVSARKATLLDPTQEDETVKVLCRRLFKHIDEGKARAIVEEYCRLWDANREHLPDADINDANREAFFEGYPLHPDLIATLKEKTSTLGNFQRVRGMLRLLARTVNRLWQKRPPETYAIHLHHIDLSSSPIRQEVLTKLGQQAYTPAMAADVTAVEGDKPSLAEQIDSAVYQAMPPYASFVARCIFFHTLAFNENLRGATENELCFSILAPGVEASFIADARRRFVQESAYLDDRPNRPLRFMVEPNLTQMIHRRERMVNPGDVRTRLNDAIKTIFKGDVFQAVFFPALSNEIEDTSTSRPLLVVMGYEATAVSVTDARITVPELVCTMFQRRSADGGTRINRNNLVFVVADDGKVEDMKSRMRLRIALEDMRNPANQQELADHQKEQLRERYNKAEQEVAICIQQTYRHVFYPARNRLEGSPVELAHATVEYHNASANPGSGQAQVVRVLQGANKLRRDGDNPDSPLYIIERTPLKKGQITTAALRDEFRRDVALPMLAGENIFMRSIRLGIEQGEFVYKSGELVCGKGDPFPSIEVNEQAFVLTATYARENKIWPKEVVPPPPAPAPSPGPDHGGAAGTGGTGPGPKPGPGDGDAPSSSHVQEISHEGVLKEVLTRIWEDARKAGFAAIASLELNLFQAQDGFALLGAVSSAPACEKKVTLAGSYETSDGSTCELNYEGTVTSLQEIKEFLLPQLRAAADKSVSIVYLLTFPNELKLAGHDAEDFGDRLTSIGSVTAFVKATARRQ